MVEMSSIATAMLFLPPFPPLPLRSGTTVVVGRSRSCELTLPSADASRRHAEIVSVHDGFLVRDLRSTNGTFVNGERVEERQLRPGDRIEIGGDTITFCQVGGALANDPGGEAETILVERPALGEAFQGDLAEIPPFAVLQILELGRKSGVIHIESEAGDGHLWLERGTPIHAETKQQSGFDAALAIVSAKTGRFRFESLGESPEATIEASVTELLLEASRLHDESLI
jgi:pSer/pThr/pTyr-binding forkhead associated (FHA) protein